MSKSIDMFGAVTFHEPMDLWNDIIEKLPHNPPAKGLENDCPVWTDGSEILCRSEWLAMTIADVIDSLLGMQKGEYYLHYHYYDPEEDEREGCIDSHTGWWYVDFE